MLESVEDQYIKVGQIARSHGVQGEVLIIPELYAPTLFDVLDLVRIEDARGDLLPARIESVRVQEKNNRLSFFVKFEHITDRTQADTLKQFAVFAERETVSQFVGEEDDSESLLSYSVIVGDNQIGTVAGIIDNPAHPILDVRTTEQDQLLIPCVEEYIVDVDEDKQQIQCKNLDQLTKL
ncbi:ribosome maturation factor RimM [Fodinibius salsisoli]|uniref:Ribosome maturation factor RimM n=1 Tax=Fodinibius salsisoli TaxID=2820877 RepID=A0ABT3PLS3_9BACT|nr:ribosome maturation factor RimM [Fodinibius salsisoli]MCW9706891.1 16S rRNA processing protein RimM [Fodinibius salsisoli]